MNNRKLVKRIVVAFVLMLLMVVSGTALFTYFYKDVIIDKFVESINKNLNAPINVGKIDISFFDDFPSVSISTENVLIKDAIKGSSGDLAKAKKLYFSFNTWQLIKGNYVVDNVGLVQAEVWLRVNRYGQNNYNLIKKGESKNKKVAFDLNNIDLSNVLVHYINIPQKQEHDLFTQKLNAKMRVVGAEYKFNLLGDLMVQKISVDKKAYVRDKNFYITGDLLYDHKKKMLSISPSMLNLNNSDFSVSGYYSFLDGSDMDIQVSSEKTNVNTLLSLMPKEVGDALSGYKSKGSVYFQGQLNGKLAGDVYPGLNVEFGFNDASIYHPEFKKSIEHVDLSGSLKMASVIDLSSGQLNLSDFECNLDGKTLKGNMALIDFKKKNINLSIAGPLDLRSFLEFYPIKEFSSAKGSFDFDISLKGQIADVEEQSFKTTGEIVLKDVAFDYVTYKLPFRDFNGTFLFNNSDLAISDFSGKIGNSNFKLNGIFRNILATIFQDKKGINIEADLASTNINLDELLSGNAQVQSGGSDYSFALSKNLKLRFDCKIDRLKFRRFLGEGIGGHLELSDQIAVLTDIKTTSIGGEVLLNAKVNAVEKDRIKIESFSKYNGLEIDSIFYVFENFNQSFLEDRHLKGQVKAEVKTNMIFDSKLNLDMPSLTSEVKIIIKNGELNNFEPMKRLSKFVEEKSLARLRFSDLQNTIIVKNQVVNLPQMEVKSNVSNILIRGTHTFDQKIDYYLKVPLTRIDKIDKDEAFGAVEDDGVGIPNLFLTIRGTTSEYKIAYDKKAVGKKIKADLKKEGQELKEIFQNKGKVDDKSLELEEDDYFDFEEDSIN